MSPSAGKSRASGAYNAAQTISELFKRCQVEGPNYVDSSHLTKRACKSATVTLTDAGPPGEPPEPPFNLPNFADEDDCNCGARLLRLRQQRAAALGNDPLGPEEYEAEEGEGEGEGESDRKEVAGTHSSEDLATIIAELASAHCRSSTHNPLNWLQDIANHVQTPKDVHINFLVMVNYMTLVCKCQSVRLKTGLHLTGIYKPEIKPNDLFIAIACGGSIHSLVLIASLGLRVAVASMVGTMHLNLANMLRSPPPNSPQRKLIMEHIAPTIAHMRLMFPLAMDMMFSAALIARFAVSKSVDCMDLSGSDRFFDAIIQNPPLSDIEEDKVEHIVIKTSYNLLSPENKRFKAPRNKADNSIWSTKERSHAEAGERVRSIEGLKLKLAKLYHKGVKITQDAYLRIPMHIIPNHHLELQNADDSLMAFVSTGTPDSYMIYS
ncbi:hypothetical protein EV702DRAFT_1195670 [Suillus placidus]|uniref:Uncharacterized protein n=1 Tax=Suillus placidus TaxID=48579 RepID=A0A9P7D5D0_9AGAM|nr:hypothetical protein EV702DRAFT_1195670 [Suillus placidus]